MDKKRIIVPLDPDDLAVLGEFQHTNRISTRAGAIRRLIREGSLRLPDRGTLANAIQSLREHKKELKELGISHAAVFGSVARGDAGEKSDMDILIEFAHNKLPDVFSYAGICRRISEILPGADIVEAGSVREELAQNIKAEAIYAF